MSPVKLITLFAVLLLAGVGFLLYDLHSARENGAAIRANRASPSDLDDRTARTSRGAAVSRSSEGDRGKTVEPAVRGVAGGAVANGETAESAPSQSASVPHVSAVAPPRVGRPSAFANPRFLSDPERRANVDQSHAIDAAEHGETPIERTNAIQWLMASGDASAFPVMQSLERNDPDPEVRNAAAVAVNLLRSRFGDVLMGR